jgi:hypothetical protein
MKQPMKSFWFSVLLIIGSVWIFSQSVYALDTTQKNLMNSALTGKSGKLSVASSGIGASTTTSTSYTDAVKGVRLGVTLLIAGLYFLFVAWLAKSQYVAWAEGDIDSKEGFGSLVSATLLLLLIVFILTT